MRFEIILLLGIVYLIYDLVFKKKTSSEKKDTEIDKELNEAKLTFPKSQYYSFADSLETSMENATTDEETIYSVFKKLKTNADYLMLTKAFGKRVYTGEVFGSLFSMLDFSEGNSLEQWLNFELDDVERNELNIILKKKNISYRI
jgi:hypothetical protein